MIAADVDRCVELERILFPGDDPWSAAAFRSELASPHNHYFTARSTEGAAMVGYAGISLLGNAINPEAEIHTIAVDPSVHRSGAGSQLLTTLLDIGEKHGGPVFLEVRTDNVPAIALYRKFGFDIVGTRARYYQPSGADAFTMCRPVTRERDPR